MGWWWNSGTSPSKSSDQFTSKITPTIQSDLSQSSSAVTEQLKPAPQQKPTTSLTREELAEKELAAFLREINEPATSPPLRKTDGKSLPRPDDISPDSLYPTEISCRSALDYALFCQSFGGQFVNVYRYGTYRSCSNHWSDFWLCMRTRRWEKQERESMIADHYRKKAVKYKTGPSSEDV